MVDKLLQYTIGHSRSGRRISRIGAIPSLHSGPKPDGPRCRGINLGHYSIQSQPFRNIGCAIPNGSPWDVIAVDSAIRNEFRHCSSRMHDLRTRRRSTILDRRQRIFFGAPHSNGSRAFREYLLGCCARVNVRGLLKARSQTIFTALASARLRRHRSLVVRAIRFSFGIFGGWSHSSQFLPGFSSVSRLGVQNERCRVRSVFRRGRCSLGPPTAPQSVGCVNHFFIVRFLASVLATRIANQLAKEPPVIKRWAWAPLVSQAGLTLALAATLTREFPAIGESLRSLVIATVAMNEIIGPILFKIALDRTRETRQKMPSRSDLLETVA